MIINGKKLRVAAIIAAGGCSSRMGIDKLLYSLNGKTVLYRSVLPFIGFDVVVVARPQSKAEQYAAALKGINCIFCDGGSTRTESVKNALAAIDNADIVLIHDGARPFVSTELVKNCIYCTYANGSAVAGLPCTDTVRYGHDGDSQLDRNTTWLVQTPQGFNYKKLVAAYSTFSGTGTDDSCVYQADGNKITMLMGEKANIKLTTPEDLLVAEAFMHNFTQIRVGSGYDVHAFRQGRKLMLCGVDIPCESGLDGHSDADVAIHALMDALLGAAGLRDIGFYFPDNDPAYSGISSIKLLQKVMQLLDEHGFSVINADVTVIAQAPKLAPYIEQMKNNLASALNIEPNCVAVKATTTEHLGFTGRCEGIASQASVLLEHERNI